MKINNRLISISKYVDKNSNVIDVGCDHALLCINLIKNNISNFCIASDINPGPLEQAHKNVFLYDLENKIKIKQGNGLDTIEDEIDTIIISGMGGNTILDIFDKGKNKLKNIKKIIISPNNDSYLVRRILTSLSYKIDVEEIICEKDKFYPIIVFSKGTSKYSVSEMLFGYNVINNKNSKDYYNYLLNKNLGIVDSITDKKQKKVIKLKIMYLKQILGIK